MWFRRVSNSVLSLATQVCLSCIRSCLEAQSKKDKNCCDLNDKCPHPMISGTRNPFFSQLVVLFGDTQKIWTCWRKSVTTSRVRDFKDFHNFNCTSSVSYLCFKIWALSSCSTALSVTYLLCSLILQFNLLEL